MHLFSPTALALTALFGPLSIAILLACVSRLRTLGWPAVWLSVSMASVAALAAAALLVRLPPTEPVSVEISWLPMAGQSLVEVGLRIDGISSTMLVIVTLVAWAVQMFSIGYLHEEPAPALGRYFAYHSFFVFSMNLLVLAPNLLELFVGWELVGLTSYLLIGFYYRKPSAGHAAIKAFWVTKFADMGLVLGLMVLYLDSGSFAFDARPSASAALVVTALLFLAVMGKSAQFPLHVWLPNAMEGPTPVSALLHAATMVAAGVYLLVRANPLFAQAPVTLAAMTWIGAFTALFAATIALYQTDIKRVLAYSTCSQLGYMVAAAGVGAPVAAYFHLTTHAFFKALLFLGAGSVIHAVHSNEISAMGGLRQRMPLTFVTFAMGALALAGLPGLSGFFSKDLVLESVAEQGQLGPLALLLVAAFLTALYMAKLVIRVFFGEPTDTSRHARESSRSMTIPLVVLGLGALVAGWFAASFAERVGGHYHFHLGWAGILGTSLGLAGLVSAWFVYGRHVPVFQGSAANRWVERVVQSRAVDRLYELLFVRVLLQASRAVAWTDRYVVDGAMNWLAWGSMVAGRRLRRLESGNVLDYALAVAAGATALVAWRLFQ